MGKRHTGSRALAALIAIALIFAGLWGAYRVGWQEGYRLGWLVERSQTGESSPAEPYGARPGIHGPFAGPRVRGMAYARPLSCLRPLFAFLLLALFLSVLAKVLGFWAWRRGWGPAGADWHKHWAHGPHGPYGPHGPHGPHGPMPPWCWGEGESAGDESDTEEPVEEQVGKVKPE